MEFGDRSRCWRPLLLGRSGPAATRPWKLLHSAYALPATRWGFMKQHICRTAVFALVFAVLGGGLTPANAQYFGRNKVQYEKFDWRIMKSDHFDLYFYPAESIKVRDAGRQEERWYARFSEIFRHQFDRKSIV